METYKKPLILNKNEIHGGAKGIFPLAGVAIADVVVAGAAALGFAKALGEDDARPEFARTLTERKNFALA